MHDAANPATQKIIGKALIGAESLLDSIREKIAAALADKWETNTSPAYMAFTIRSVFDRARPILVEHIADTDMAAWVTGMDALSKQFPPWLLQEFESGIREKPPAPPANRFTLLESFGENPKLRFPLIEEAAKRLAERNILTRDQWDSVSQDAREKAFTITGEITDETIRSVRDVLVYNLDSGTSLQGFKKIVGDTLEASGIGPSRIETIYRTNVQTAFRDGRETLAANPIVAELFPYQAYLAIHDARTRSWHRDLEKYGLNGTNVYRRDDPFWNMFTPPNGYNCRCGVRLMTVEAAARAGVEEAREWLRSGRPPASPQWRYQQVPFEPEPGFGSRGKVAIAA